MWIHSVRVQHFRSIESAGISPCGGLNVLIGKNNAGKSNLMSAIELMLLHLRHGRIVGPGYWRGGRWKAEFTDRDDSIPIRIGVEFDLPPELNRGLCDRLGKEAPHLERSIEQIKSHNDIVFVLAGTISAKKPFLFIEQITIGKLGVRNGDISPEGITILSVPKSVALELYSTQLSVREIESQLKLLEELRSDERSVELTLERVREGRSSRFYPRRLSELPEKLREKLTSSMGSIEEFRRNISVVAEEFREKIVRLESSDTEGFLSTFAGESGTSPAYAEWLIKQYGAIAFMHLREARRPIGREEAETLLQLKVRRGGPERLLTVQKSIRSLLGVNVDAFQGESARGSAGEPVAEMDVDEFLVEANGAGIREALRIMLDLELKIPQLVLIEEPEVHLHPSLSRVIASYLREKSHEIQMFIATHSTDFVDSVSFQSVFLVSRDSRSKTACHAIEPEEAAIKIPAELGLRLSTVFMYDRLVFVEGPSDENVLREFARKLDVDLTESNVGFTYMGGVRNFAHFAAEATLELLSRRRIQMWFVADRDESEEDEVKRMAERLGERAHLAVLKMRELENYLLDESAIASFIEAKQKAGGVVGPKAEAESVRMAIEEEAIGLKDEVAQLRLKKRLLKPIFLHTRTAKGSIAERIRSATKELSERLRRIEKEQATISAELDKAWETNALNHVPGAVLLQRVAKRFGTSFSKEKGDSQRLARLLPASAIKPEIEELLRQIGQAGEP